MKLFKLRKNQLDETRIRIFQDVKWNIGEIVDNYIYAHKLQCETN